MNLADATYENTSEYMIKGIYDYKTIRVYDGDTVWIAIKTPVVGVEEADGKSGESEVWRICCRISGIDTPEMPRSYADAMMDYYKKAYAERDRVVELTTDIAIDKNATYTDTRAHRCPPFRMTTY